jgi:uncharacterized protein
LDSESFDPKTFSGVVPVFPLPNVVLLPGMFLPLHIFEPRYRQMTADALQGERLIAMALLKPGWQQDYEGSPPIHEIVGVGKIVEDAKLPDGRYNLVLFGLSRVRILEEIGKGPYRTARVEVLGEREPEGRDAERKRRILLGLLEQAMLQMAGTIAKPPEDIPLGMLCDIVSSVIPLDPPTRQSLLAELDVSARCSRLLEVVQTPSPERKKPWPMGPSLN